ncbi:MAG: hypothetical protein HC902_09830 [Calothrix sp. SM1_5_4]|nr:hypothetical protein [Calothrix sp. SM1_5_4]
MHVFGRAGLGVSSALSLWLASVADAQNNYNFPLRPARAQEVPSFDDDLDLHDLKTAVDRQLRRYAKKNLNGTLSFGGRSYPLVQAKESLVAFRALIETFEECSRSGRAGRACREAFKRGVKERFDIYVPNLLPGEPRFGDERSAFSQAITLT